MTEDEGGTGRSIDMVQLISCCLHSIVFTFGIINLGFGWSFTESMQLNWVVHYLLIFLTLYFLVLPLAFRQEENTESCLLTFVGLYFSAVVGLTLLFVFAHLITGSYVDVVIQYEIQKILILSLMYIGYVGCMVLITWD